MSFFLYQYEDSIEDLTTNSDNLDDSIASNTSGKEAEAEQETDASSRQINEASNSNNNSLTNQTPVQSSDLTAEANVGQSLDSSTQPDNPNQKKRPEKITVRQFLLFSNDKL